jgi:hypothetical protein
MWESATTSATETADQLSKRPATLKRIGTSSRLEPGKRWATFVDNFSSCQLTVATDKLVAISGIAKTIQSGFECRYFAGLWEADFVHQLGWRKISNFWATIQEPAIPIFTRPTDYIAPSWSWASINGQIRLDMRQGSSRNSDETLTALLDVHLQHMSADTFGQVKSGFALLLGPLFQATVSYEGDCADFAICGLELTLAPGFDILAERPRSTESIFFLALEMSDNARGTMVTGLILKPVPDTTDCFSRVGLSVIQDYGDAEIEPTDEVINVRAFIQRLQTPGKIARMPEELLDPERGYTIKLYRSKS